MAKRIARKTVPAVSVDEKAGALPAQPNDQHLAWYRAWSVEFRGVTDLAAEMGLPIQEAYQLLCGVEAWMRRVLFTEVTGFRVRQSEALERSAEKALRAWHDSSDIRYMAEARRILLDLRKLWDLDTPAVTSPVDDRAEQLERVAGMRRADALRAQAARLTQLADDLT